MAPTESQTAILGQGSTHHLVPQGARTSDAELFTAEIKILIQIVGRQLPSKMD